MHCKFPAQKGIFWFNYDDFFAGLVGMLNLCRCALPGFCIFFAFVQNHLYFKTNPFSIEYKDKFLGQYLFLKYHFIVKIIWRPSGFGNIKLRQRKEWRQEGEIRTTPQESIQTKNPLPPKMYMASRVGYKFHFVGTCGTFCHILPEVAVY